MRNKDQILMTKIISMKQAGISTDDIAKELKVHPETVRRYCRSKEFKSIAHSMAVTNSGKLQTLFEDSLKLAQTIIAEVDEDGVPTKRASDMAKTLLNTQVSRLLGTKADEVEEEADPIEKANLIKELTDLARGAECQN